MAFDGGLASAIVSMAASQHITCAETDSQRLMYPQECSIILVQHPVRIHFEKTRSHAEGQCAPWGHTRRQCLYLLEQVVAETGSASAMTRMPDAPMNKIARESLRIVVLSDCVMCFLK
jgi:hypothetical protein